MATRTYDEDELLATILGALQRAYPTRSVGPKSDLGHLGRTIAETLGAVQSAISDADRDGIPASEVVDGVLKSRASTARLDEWAAVFGLPSNRGAGLFGRNGAVVATGGAGQVLGTAGTVVPGGALLTDLSGQVEAELVSGVTVGGGGSVAGAYQATSAGAAGNLATGTTLRWVSPVAGLGAYVTLSTGLSGGYDVESDLALLVRLLAWLRSPPHGGTCADIRRWAEESTDSDGRSLGIGRCYMFKWRNGLGSSDAVITQAGSGSARDPGSTKAAKVQTYIDDRRIPSDAIRVVRPYFPSGQALGILIRGIPAARAAFDWQDGGGVVIVSATTTLIKISTGNVPASLAAAVAAGTKPRVQVALASVGALPQQARIASSAPNGGDTDFTLETALGAAPANGSTIYAGGGAVEPVSLAVLDHIDHIGPSQQSGTQDQVTDAWEAIVSVGRVAQVALEAVDATGARVLVYSPGVGQGVGVQIKVGAGGYAAADVPLYDNVPGQGPQLPEAASILVIQGTP